MIVKMKRYAFLVFHREYGEFLNDIQQLGVVHVQEKAQGTPYDESMGKMLKNQSRIQTAMKTLQKRTPVPIEPQSGMDANWVLETVENILSAIENKKTTQQQIEKEISLLQPWGNFSWELIDKIGEAGRTIHFFSVLKSKFKTSWETDHHAFVVGESSSNIFFITISDLQAAPEIAADLVRLPRQELKTLHLQKEQLEKELADLNHALDEIASFGIDNLQNNLRENLNTISLEKVRLNSEPAAENRVMLLEGWVPDGKEQNLLDLCYRKNIFFNISEPTLKDQVPVLLKNNSFTRLFEMIGSLYSLPNYHELDLTPLFAPFFMLFFGFCLGDAGYGLLMLLGATAYKMIKKDLKLRPILSLVQWLGFATVIMGFISGTFFGVALVEIEGFSLKEYILNSNQLFYLSMIIGLVQIIFGLCVKAYSQIVFKGIKYALSTLGWILLIVGLISTFVLDSFKILPPELKPILMYSILGVSGVLILVFCDPDTNPLVSSLKGIWDVYGMVTGVFGDTLSYIRLFALGTSGAILGFVINTVALQFLGIPVIGPVLFVIFLLFGHSLTIALSALGAFVHPMRLTFVEFYKNAGFSGGGKKYQPFQLEIKQ